LEWCYHAILIRARVDLEEDIPGLDGLEIYHFAVVAVDALGLTGTFPDALKFAPGTARREAPAGQQNLLAAIFVQLCHQPFTRGHRFLPVTLYIVRLPAH